MRWIFLTAMWMMVLSWGTDMKIRAEETPGPALIPIVEMEPIGKEYSRKPATVSSEMLEKFRQAWKKVAPGVEARTTSEMLYEISRWAKEQMKGYQPPTGWISTIPLTPVGMGEDGRSILFFQETEQGFAIPSHSPIVFRRLMVGAVYDPQTNTIIHVYITIRGWKEE